MNPQSEYDFSDLNDDQVLWLTDLLTTDATQCIGSLETDKGFCCLGRACIVLEPETRLEEDGFITYETRSEVLSEKLQKKLCLRSNNAEFNISELVELDVRAFRETSWSDFSSLTEFNDNKKFSFKEIAEFILRNKKAVFTDDV